MLCQAPDLNPSVKHKPLVTLQATVLLLLVYEYVCMAGGRGKGV